LISGRLRNVCCLVYAVSVMFKSEAFELVPSEKAGIDYLLKNKIISAVLQIQPDLNSPGTTSRFQKCSRYSLNPREHDLTERHEKRDQPSESTHQLRGKLFRLHMHINYALPRTRHRQNKPSSLVLTRARALHTPTLMPLFSLDPSGLKFNAYPSAVPVSL
jgi:hypothetical protein